VKRATNELIAVCFQWRERIFRSFATLWHGRCCISHERNEMAHQPTITFRRITMKSTLMITDLSVSKELGREELAAVRGGIYKNYDANPAAGGVCGTGTGGPVMPDIFPPVMLPFTPFTQPGMFPV
jgi:hypothetical protein